VEPAILFGIRPECLRFLSILYRPARSVFVPVPDLACLQLGCCDENAGYVRGRGKNAQARFEAKEKEIKSQELRVKADVRNTSLLFTLDFIDVG
jgi:hypothetical protein